ncbi:hypothetical protein K7432_008797 [Basidiobolus ranarum]|uniref:Uncharacterized protein n=1 Tax=Basidiobolus ranarum TaxID=34480 RepID=A0ABR2WRB0_9FUNG
MLAYKSIFILTLLAVGVFNPLLASADSCEDCLTTKPFQAMSGCQDFNYDKELRPTPSDLFKKCACQLSEAATAFDLCSSTCSQTRLNNQKEGVAAMKKIFSCQNVSGSPSANLPSSSATSLPASSSAGSSTGLSTGSPTVSSSASSANPNKTTVTTGVTNSPTPTKTNGAPSNMLALKTTALGAAVGVILSCILF